jgi:hypothetical protein
LRILIPDAQHEGEPDIERGAAGPGATLDIHRARRPADIADESWRACDGIVVYHEISIGAAELARATNCRIIVRGGAALDVIPNEPPNPGDRLIEAWRRGDEWMRGRLNLSPPAVFYSAAGFEDLRRKSMETAAAFLQDGTLRTCVNLDYVDRAGDARVAV